MRQQCAKIFEYVDNFNIRWDLRPKRKPRKSIAHALRQVELREKRKAIRKLHEEICKLPKNSIVSE